MIRIEPARAMELHDVPIILKVRVYIRSPYHVQCKLLCSFE